MVFKAFPEVLYFCKTDFSVYAIPDSVMSYCIHLQVSKVGTGEVTIKLL